MKISVIDTGIGIHSDYIDKLSQISLVRIDITIGTRVDVLR